MSKIVKAVVLSTLTLSLCLIVTTGWILLTPIRVYAATCCADCGPSAPEVCCTGTGVCVATDKSGCRASNGQSLAPMIRNCQVY